MTFQLTNNFSSFCARTRSKVNTSKCSGDCLGLTLSRNLNDKYYLSYVPNLNFLFPPFIFLFPPFLPPSLSPTPPLSPLLQ